MQVSLLKNWWKIKILWMVKLISSPALRDDGSFSSVLKINCWHIFNACSEFRSEDPCCSGAFLAGGEVLDFENTAEKWESGTH